MPDSLRTRRNAIIIFLLVVATAAILLGMGRVPICTCGTVKLWVGEANGPDNSQHISDWYTPSHIIHGMLFFGLTFLLFRRWSLSGRLIFATLIEAGWEILENSPLIINRYRTATMALDYYGDSVLNSVSDLFAMMLGFYLAARLPVAVTVLLALALEVIAAYVIRDNLTLNVIMLIYPIDAIKAWQASG